MVGELEDVDVGLAVPGDAGLVEPGEDVVVARVAGQQHRLAVALGEHDDAREVVRRVVAARRRGGGVGDRLGVVLQPLVPRLAELLELLGVRHTTVSLSGPSVIVRTPSRGSTTGPSKGSLTLQPSVWPGRQLAALGDARDDREAGGADLVGDAVVDRRGQDLDGGGAQVLGVVAEHVVEGVVPQRADLVAQRLGVLLLADELAGEVDHARRRRRSRCG